MEHALVDRLRGERDDMLAVLGFDQVDPAERERLDRSFEDGPDEFTSTPSSGAIHPRTRTLVAVRAEFCPFTCRPYRNPPHASPQARDPWAAGLWDAIEQLHRPLGDAVVVRHGWWVVVAGSAGAAELASVARTVVGLVRSPEAGDTRRLAGIWGGREHVTSDPGVVAGPGMLVHDFESERFGPVVRLRSVVVLHGRRDWLDWLLECSIDVRFADREGLVSDSAMIGDELARRMPPGARLDAVNGHDGETLRCEGHWRTPDEPVDDAGVIAASEVIAALPIDVVASRGLAYARKRNILPDAFESAGDHRAAFSYRRCPTGPWVGDDTTVSIAAFGPPPDSTLRIRLAWAGVPRNIGRAVIEATSHGVAVTEDGDAAVVGLLLEALRAHDHGDPGSRWYLDGDLLVAQVWTGAAGGGDAPSGLGLPATLEVFADLDRRVRSM